jgi:hypothetical protein
MNTIKIYLTHCITLEDVLDDIKEGLSDKNPQFKMNILKLLEAIFEKNSKLHKNGIKILLPNIKKLFEDGSAEVRDKSLVLAGQIKNSFGEKFFGNLLIDLKPLQLQKINQQVEKSSELTPEKFPQPKSNTIIQPNINSFKPGSTHNNNNHLMGTNNKKPVVNSKLTQ